MAQSSALESPTLAVSLTDCPGRRRDPRAAPREPRLRHPLRRAHGAHRLRRRRGLAPRPDPAVRAVDLLDPATNVFHYGQAIFEGLKAYAQPDGGSRRSGPRRTPPGSPASPSGWPCRRCRRNASSGPSTFGVPDRAWVPTGATDALPATVHDRDRAASACARPRSTCSCVIGSPGRRVLPAAASKPGLGVALRGLHPRRARRDRPPRRPATTPRA